MPPKSTITVGPLKSSEMDEADRVFRTAFSSFLGLPNPADFMAGRDLIASRAKGRHVKALAARDDGRLIGSNLATRWGSFGFFGPLTVLPEYWDRGVAKLLLSSTVKIFDGWGLKHTGLFTFAQSAKHICLYQKFGYWPMYLTAIMEYKPGEKAAGQPALLSALSRDKREEAIHACSKLTSSIQKGLDLSDEIRAMMKQHGGEVVLIHGKKSGGNKRGNALDGFAICMHGAGSEGGASTCYVKFAAARGGDGAAERFDRLLEACDGFAAARGVRLEAGVNLARDDAYRRMRSRGYRTLVQGVALQRPHLPGFNRSDAYVIDDWR
jgi:GNAT superfamily N-acetyltransferase